jgi:hypothetical protein
LLVLVTGSPQRVIGLYNDLVDSDFFFHAPRLQRLDSLGWFCVPAPVWSGRSSAAFGPNRAVLGME